MVLCLWGAATSSRCSSRCTRHTCVLMMLTHALGDAVCSQGQLPALTALDHAGVYQQRLAGLMEAVVCPVLQLVTNAGLQQDIQVRDPC